MILINVWSYVLLITSISFWFLSFSWLKKNPAQAPEFDVLGRGHVFQAPSVYYISLFCNLRPYSSSSFLIVHCCYYFLPRSNLIGSCKILYKTHWIGLNKNVWFSHTDFSWNWEVIHCNILINHVLLGLLIVYNPVFYSL